MPGARDMEKVPTPWVKGAFASPRLIISPFFEPAV